MTKRQAKKKSGPRAWSDYDAVAACEGFDGGGHSDAAMISAWQHLIDTGLAFRLQGSFGRQAMRLIEAGLCNGPRNHVRVA